MLELRGTMRRPQRGATARWVAEIARVSLDSWLSRIKLVNLLLVATLLLLLGYLCRCFVQQAGAQFGTFCLLLLVSYLTFVSNESSYIHHAQEHENRFTTAMAMLFGYNLLFTPDSPLGFVGRWSWQFGLLVVLLLGAIACYWDRAKHRSRLSTPRFKKLGKRPDKQAIHDSLTKLLQIVTSLQMIDNPWIPSTVSRFFRVRQIMDVEMGILSVFDDTTAAELNYIIDAMAQGSPETGAEGKISLALLVYKVKDHNADAMHRTALLEILTNHRVSDLSVKSRAHVLDALQQMMLTAHKNADRFTVNILRNTKGGDLTRLKLLTDSKGDYQSLHKLVFKDITSPDARAEVLNHIRLEANKLKGALRIGGSRGKRFARRPWRKILSDVDDTLSCSGGRYPAGCDKQLPRKAIYPGVLDLYRELDLGADSEADWYDEVQLAVIRNNEDWLLRDVGNLVFLSARPHFYRDWLESHSFEKFRKLQEDRGLYATPTMLAGDIGSGAAYMMTDDFEYLAKKKFQNLLEYAQLYPEYSHVFIGDNGQGDVRAAELVHTARRQAELPVAPDGHLAAGGPAADDGAFGARPPFIWPELVMTYIHLVRPINETHGWDKNAPERWKEMNIVFVRNYVEAAHHAAVVCKPPLIRPEGLRRVMAAARRDFQKLSRWDKLPDPKGARESLRLRLNQSLAVANAALATLPGGLQPVPLIDAVCEFAVGSRVATSYGKGVVREFRPKDGVYTVELEWIVGGRPASAFLQFDQLAEPGDERPGALAKFFEGLSRPHPPRTAPDGHGGLVPGVRVRTSFGPGTVRELRREAVPDAAAAAAEPAPLSPADAQPDTGPVRADKLASPAPAASRLSAATPTLAELAPEGKVTAVVVELEWKLANDKPAVAFIRAGDVSLAAADAAAVEDKRSWNLLSFLKKPLELTSPSRGAPEPAMPAEPLASPADRFEAGAAVTTPFGPARVIRRRHAPGDGLYEVVLEGFGGTSADPRRSTARGYLREDALNPREVAAPGTPVLTRFGAGVVLRVRPESGVHVVECCPVGTRNSHPASPPSAALAASGSAASTQQSAALPMPPDLARPPPTTTSSAPGSPRAALSPSLPSSPPSPSSEGTSSRSQPSSPPRMLRTGGGASSPSRVFSLTKASSLPGRAVKAGDDDWTVVQRRRARGAMLLYLQPEQILRVLVALPGDRVHTSLGVDGVLRRVRAHDGVHEVDLDWTLAGQQPANAFLQEPYVTAMGPGDMAAQDARRGFGVMDLFSRIKHTIWTR